MSRNSLIDGSAIRTREVALGCWAFGGHGYGEVDDDTSIATIEAAVDFGLTCIDTSPVYGQGHSEKIVGEALRRLGHRADNVSVITKCGFAWDGNGKPYADNSVSNLQKSIHQSLSRLGVDRIDFLLLHRYDGQTPFDRIFQTLERFVESGNVAAYGLCNWEECKADLIDLPPGLSMLQSKYNLLQSQNLALLKAAKNRGAINIVYDVLARGLFTGKYSKASQFSANDTRSNDFYFRKENIDRHLRLTERMVAVAKELEVSPSSVAIAWALEQPEIDIALVGAKTPTQVLANMSARELVLPHEMMRFIEGDCDV